MLDLSSSLTFITFSRTPKAFPYFVYYCCFMAMGGGTVVAQTSSSLLCVVVVSDLSGLVACGHFVNGI